MSLTIEDIQHYPIGVDGLKCTVGEEIKTFAGVGIMLKPKPLEWVDFTDGSDYEIGLIKPCLFPLSDLTKPITIKGETFTPMDRIKEELLHEWCDVYNQWFDMYLGRLDSVDSISQGPYELIMWFIGKFIDVNNLIGQGKAISVHDLDVNPYA